MQQLTKDDVDRFATALAGRKQALGEEIRRALARTEADPRSDVAFAEVPATPQKGRIAAGTYATCVDCGLPVGKKRLEADPTATRCVEDQERREKLRAGPRHSRV